MITITEIQIMSTYGKQLQVTSFNLACRNLTINSLVQYNYVFKRHSAFSKE